MTTLPITMDWQSGRDTLDEIYVEADNNMEATAEILSSTFACYGHGLLMKPIYDYNLPGITYEDCAQQILNNHEDTWNAVISILKEVKE